MFIQKKTLEILQIFLTSHILFISVAFIYFFFFKKIILKGAPRFLFSIPFSSLPQHNTTQQISRSYSDCVSTHPNVRLQNWNEFQIAGLGSHTITD